MSALTKLFVVLLIICSLLLTAGVVVYINKGDVYATLMTNQEQTLARARADAQIANARADAAVSREADLVSQNNRLVGDLQSQIAAAKQDASSKVAEAATLRTKLAVQDANITEMSGALQVQASNLTDMQKRYDETVKQLDGIRGQNVELVAANTDYQKRLDELEREREFLNEQIAQLKATGTAPPANANARNMAVPNIEGVISSVREDGGVKYATISVGASDRVQQGMQFNVIDRQAQQFLGKLTVESVQPNEAFGRLEGPRVNEIKAQNEVRTQL